VLILLFIFLGLISLVLATLLSFAIALPAALFRTAVLVLTALLSLLTFPAIALLTALLAATLIALLTALLIFAIALLLVRLLALLICHLCSPFSSLTNRLNRENLELSLRCLFTEVVHSPTSYYWYCEASLLCYAERNHTGNHVIRE
jgi:hypothetical protein